MPDFILRRKRTLPDTGPDTQHAEGSPTRYPASRDAPNPDQRIRPGRIKFQEDQTARKSHADHHVALITKVATAPVNSVRGEGQSVGRLNQNRRGPCREE